MFIDIDSIKINLPGESEIDLGQYLVQANFGYHKLWASDSGRNLAGSQTGTLIGIFPKLTLQFRSLNQTELELLVPILDSASQEVTYYDPYKKAETTMSTYAGDWTIANKRVGKNEGFKCSFISKEKRS